MDAGERPRSRRRRLGLTRRGGIAALAATVTLVALAGAADAKSPQLRFEQRRVAAGTTIRATIQVWPSARRLERLRFFLVHGRDLNAMFPPHEWMLFGKEAHAAIRDARFIELDVAPVAGSETRDQWVKVMVALPHGIRPGSYTTSVLSCQQTCVLELALTPRRLSILRSISKWNQKFALRID